MMLNKYLLGVVIVVVALGGYFYFHGKKSTPSQNSQTQQSQNDQNNSTNQKTAGDTTTTNSTDNQQPVATTTEATVQTSLGTFQIALDAKAAPKTVANFIKLANQGFYNGLTFHRIVKQTGFHLIQGGDPAGNGTGGPGYTIPAEIGLKHTKGAIAMARLGDDVNPNRESSGSQFYIVEEDIPYLDGQYSVFGYVTSGMDVVEKIGSVATGQNDMPVAKVTINKITIK